MRHIRKYVYLKLSPQNDVMNPPKSFLTYLTTILFILDRTEGSGTANSTISYDMIVLFVENSDSAMQLLPFHLLPCAFYSGLAHVNIHGVYDCRIFGTGTYSKAVKELLLLEHSATADKTILRVLELP